MTKEDFEHYAEKMHKKIILEKTPTTSMSSDDKKNFAYLMSKFFQERLAQPAAASIASHKDGWISCCIYNINSNEEVDHYIGTSWREVSELCRKYGIDVTYKETNK